MFAAFGPISPTRLTGLLSYTVSVLACAANWVRRRKSGLPQRSFAMLMLVQIVLLLDMAFEWRWVLHDFWIREAMSHGVYDLRRTPQLLSLIVLGLILVFSVISIVHRFRHSAGEAIAVTSTTLSIGLWCCECLSYHNVDRVFYRMVGPVMMVSLLWIGFTLLTCFGIWLDNRSRPST